MVKLQEESTNKNNAFLGFANFEQSKYVLLTVLKVLVHIRTY